MSQDTLDLEDGGSVGLAVRLVAGGRPRYPHLAEYYAKLGDKDAAFEALDKSLANREWQMMYLGVDPRFDALRDDPRFADLIRQVEVNATITRRHDL